MGMWVVLIKAMPDRRRKCCIVYTSGELFMLPILMKGITASVDM